MRSYMLSPQVLALFLVCCEHLSAARLPANSRVVNAGDTAAALRGTSSAAVALHAASSNANATVATERSKQPCQCQANSNSWVWPKRTVPACVFIDLNAADGYGLRHFVQNGYGPVANCPTGQWLAILVEADPRFNTALDLISTQYPGQVMVSTSRVPYMCEGASMSLSHSDLSNQAAHKVAVPTMNINKVIYENTIPADWVLLKMDIAGSEWDVLPCLANSSSASKLDRINMVVHPRSWSIAGTTKEELLQAQAALRQKGVDVQMYFSKDN
eukprot:gnl/TRDRNA2_/TRDRNA2_190968_c0_seq1.p1 gnl/TRDRNA2_/TRDRNA2_190968_c0~~gnl/TRDRNA2_/TRDRNA2_190968_c0_seq1.p1  ORF type:complete len:272 (+),score=47.90 gnl/TRDRNA2_/TRDRNA2_190968_c0_seq1:207-1022(+)